MAEKLALWPIHGIHSAPPAYLDLDRDRRSARVRELPEREQIPVQAELSLIVEYYSR